MSALAALSLLAPDLGLASMWALKADEYQQMLAIGPAAGLGFLMLSAMLALASLGCFRRRRWGWMLAIALIAVNAASDAARALFANPLEGLVGVILAGALLWWLLRPTVRASFSG